MNLLAHAYLSFNEPDILAGNMINDYVKGKKKFDYPIAIQRGMTLHRAIDDFTDHHPATQAAKQYFRPQYRLYAGAFVDVLYDHFLANDPAQFEDEAVLQTFCHQTYSLLQSNLSVLPPKFQQVYPYMKTQNWLYNYRLLSGIEKGFEGMVKRAAYLTESAIAFSIFEQYYDAFKEYYNDFFPALKQFSFDQFEQLQNINNK